MEHEEEADFFISYALPDRAWAAWLAWQLEEAGYRTRHQGWDFRVGANFVLEMQRAAERSRRTMLVLSPSFLKSKFTPAEWAAAFARDPTGNERMLVPVRVREVDLKGLLAPIVYVDLVGLSAEEARKELLDHVSGQRRKPSIEPRFPAVAAAEEDAGPSFPGEIPSIWNAVRAARNFSERDALLEEVAVDLAAGAANETHGAVALYGLGGVGKTQMAARFAWRQRSRYDVVWWIRANEPLTRAADYSQLARALGLEAEESQAAEVEAVRTWLAGHKRWLLVFDDAPDAAAVSELLPDSSRGDVLITSRQASGWRAVAIPLEVKSWDTEQAAAFLRRRTGREGEEAESLKIATALGGLPLAMEQAGAYVDTMAITLGGYWDRLSEHSGELLETGKPIDYGGTVRSTWDLSFAEVEKDEGAKLLLSCCGNLAPDPIPEEIFNHLLPDPLRRDDALRKLLCFSLVAVDPPNLRMHVLVQQTVRERGTMLGADEARRILLKALLDLFPVKSHPHEWPLGIALLPHVLELLPKVLNSDPDRRDALRLADLLAQFHHVRGELREALALVEMIDERLEDDPELALRNLFSLGILRMTLGDAQHAQQAFEDALRVAQDKYPEGHPRIAALWDNLGIVHRRRGQTRSAIASHKKALVIFEENFGPDSAEAAATFDNLGNALRINGDLDEAAVSLERCLAIKRREYGDDDYRLARTYDSLGSVSAERGELSRARQFYERARDIQEGNLGSNHPEVGATLSNLAKRDGQPGGTRRG
ncbi:MAG: FxSxx-COOH system tetratricopeptide repeat protein [Solirubrobacterales bacterium]